MDLQSSLIAAFEEILDKMAFMVFETASAGQIGTPAFAYTSRIAFEGKYKGTLNLYVTQATAEAVSRNLLGLRDGDELFKGTVEDALGEFANILIGRALSLLDPDHAFDLNLPVTAAGISPPAGEGGQEMTIEGMLDEAEPCRMVVRYHG
jgi:CheY-specific phosphatase CheX